jgi:hypothetical protein
MVFDVMIRAGKNAAGKDVYNVRRVHDRELSSFLRSTQNVGDYIVSVIPLFRPKLKDVVSRYIVDDENKGLTDKEILIEQELELYKYRSGDNFDGL